VIKDFRCHRNSSAAYCFSATWKYFFRLFGRNRNKLTTSDCRASASTQCAVVSPSTELPSSNNVRIRLAATLAGRQSETVVIAYRCIW